MEALAGDFWMAWQTEGRPLEEEIKAAQQHFERKYGRTPTRLLIPPNLEDQVRALNGEVRSEVEAVNFLQPHHLWLS